MASQKQARPASGRGNGTATKAGSGASARTGQTSTGQTSTGQARSGQARSGRGQNGQDRRGQGGQTAGNRGGQAAGNRGGQTSGNRGGQSRATATQTRSATPAAGSPPAKAPARPAAPLWFQITTLVLSLAGLGVSIYLTIAHYTSSSILACSNNGLVNCAKVTTSAESVVFGIFPVAVLGLAFYVFMTAINTPWAWRAPLPWIAWLRTGAIISGICFVLYLIYAEVIEIGNICLWCTSVHVITFLLFVLLMSVAPFASKARAQAAS
jgi:uncharacterized membrane protein